MASLYLERKHWRLDFILDNRRQRKSFKTEEEAKAFALANDFDIRPRLSRKPPLPLIKKEYFLKRINLEERRLIEKLLKEGCSYKQISSHLNRSKSTISYEIKKGGGRENYSAEVANNSTTSFVDVNLKDLLDQIESKLMAIEIFIERFETLEKKVELLGEKNDINVNNKLR